MSELARKVMSGEVRAVARACRMVDDRMDGYRDLLRELYTHTGHAFWIGVTGSPGTGKSTLVDALIAELRKSGQRVGIVAIDPTSPWSGGAILGDRIRMQRHFEDPEVFIRSVATRGALGGLSRSTVDIARVLEAWRADAILIETVGVGQDELEVTRAAHSTLVVMAPGMGDDIQAIKAGILECADVFAVNKADRPGADATVRDLEVMLALGDKMLTSVSHSHSHSHSHSAARPAMAVAERDSWRPPIVKCVATRGEGVEQVLESLKAHREWLLGTEAGRARRSARLREQLLGTLRDEIAEAVANQLGALVDETAEKIERREIDPYSALEALTEAFRGAAAPRE